MGAELAELGYSVYGEVLEDEVEDLGWERQERACNGRGTW